MNTNSIKIKHLKNTLPVIGLIAVLCFSCNKKQSVTTDAQTGRDAVPVEFTEDRNLPTDSEIANTIETELMIQDGIAAESLKVASQDGIITLEGTVKSILARERAIEISKSFKGVRGVINDLTVKTLDLDDETLKRNVTRSLVMDPTTESYEVEVEATDGHVTLTGKVDSWHEKRLATDIAQGVNGVVSIDNNIYFDYAKTRSDEEIRDDVVSALNWDIRVDDALIDVVVENSEVTLNGIVGSASEKSQAEVNAWVAGVEAVNIDGLEVERWARDEDLRDDKYVERSDEQIREAVKDAFLYDARLNAYGIEVEVNNGEVILSGIVDNLKSKNVASMNAENVIGVWKVNNEMKVNSTEFPPEERIKSNIEEALSYNAYVEEFQIDVDYQDGTAILSGTVNSNFEKYTAEDVASKVFGVQKIENDINVAVSTIPYVYDYHYFHYYPYEYNRAPATDNLAESDAEIEENISKQIWWSPFIDSEDVNVSVDNGIATLSGTVDSWKEYQQAEINAFDGGAIVVNNNLEITRLNM